jgi:hypothetical protein
MSFAQRLQRLASITSIDSASPSPFNAQPHQCSTTPCTRAPLLISPLLCVCTTTHPPAPHELPLLYHRTRLLALLALLALLPVPSARPDSHHAYLRGCDSTSKARYLTMHRCHHDALCTTSPSILSPSRVNSCPVLHSGVRLVALHSTNAYAALFAGTMHGQPMIRAYLAKIVSTFAPAAWKPTYLRMGGDLLPKCVSSESMLAC